MCRVSLAPVSPGEVVLKIDDSRGVTDADPLDPTGGEFEHHCGDLAGGKVVMMRHPERSINHSCDPNTYTRTIAGDRHVVALRAIRLGEEVTYDSCVNGEGDTALHQERLVGTVGVPESRPVGRPDHRTRERPSRCPSLPGSKRLPLPGSPPIRILAATPSWRCTWV